MSSIKIIIAFSFVSIIEQNNNIILITFKTFHVGTYRLINVPILKRSSVGINKKNTNKNSRYYTYIMLYLLPLVFMKN